jgi:hypothetical protein
MSAVAPSSAVLPAPAVPPIREWPVLCLWSRDPVDNAIEATERLYDLEVVNSMGGMVPLPS